VKRTRREFFHRGAAAVGGVCLAVGGLRDGAAESGEAAAKNKAGSGTLQCLDYGRSFLCGTAPSVVLDDGWNESNLTNSPLSAISIGNWLKHSSSVRLLASCSIYASLAACRSSQS
jgi:hypothetical protein